jgi:nitrogenase molybdenum-iron protein alpha/beta subunit
VTTHVKDTVTVIHGPKGCTHHNFSLLHTTGLDNDQAVFVLSTCIVDTIGDDVVAVCSRDRGIPVLPIPTAGFLGGTFQQGMNNALRVIADTAEPCQKDRCVNIIGEKNLENEVEENYLEVSRLLSALGIPVNLRFLRNCSLEDITLLGAARLNILRDNDLSILGEHLLNRFKTPYISSYPVGLEGTIGFLESVADRFGIPCPSAVREEKVLQDGILDEFEDISGALVTFDPSLKSPDAIRVAREVAERTGIIFDDKGCTIPVQEAPPVGTNGVRRMLHQWRRAIHA